MTKILFGTLFISVTLLSSATNAQSVVYQGNTGQIPTIILNLPLKRPLPARAESVQPLQASGETTPAIQDGAAATAPQHDLPANQEMAAPQPATAQPAVPHPPAQPSEKAPVLPLQVAFTPTGYVEAGISASRLTNNYGNGLGEYVRTEIQTDPNNRWNAEIGHQSRFHTNGTYGVIGNTHIWNKEWYTTVGISGATKGDFLPQYRFDASINRIWEQQRLITTLGYMHFNAMDYHYSDSLLLSAAYYFESPWVLQGGIWLNKSEPGTVYSTSQFIALMQGVPKDQLITLRFEFGREAYQVLNPQQTITTDFRSYSTIAGLRKWIGEDWGVNTQFDYYHNPFYNRTGGIIGAFYEF